MFDIEWAALKAVRQQLDGNFDAAVNIIVETLAQRGKVVVVGIGKSGNRISIRRQARALLERRHGSVAEAGPLR